MSSMWGALLDFRENMIKGTPAKAIVVTKRSRFAVLDSQTPPSPLRQAKRGVAVSLGRDLVPVTW